MKISVNQLLATLFSLFLIASCTSISDLDYDKTLLVGRWNHQSPTQNNDPTKHEYFVFIADGTGKEWDEGDDVTEAEAKKFKWKLDKSNYTYIFVLEDGREGNPIYYTVTNLTAKEFSFKDSAGKKFTLNRIADK